MGAQHRLLKRQLRNFPEIPSMNADGKVGGLIIFSEDITSRKHAEEELRIASAAFQSSVTA